MTDPAVHAELVKLARILETDAETIEYLSYLEAERLRTLRDGITDALFEKFRTTFSSFARLSSILPFAISARISERVLGPMLSGRIAGEMPADKAIELSARLADGFVADTCLHIDPVRARPIIAAFPVERAVAITQILLERGELITMGRFVDVLPRETLLAAADAITDEAALLKISFFVENSEQLDVVIDHLSVERRAAIVQAAASEQLWPEIVATLLRISPASRLAMAKLAMEQNAQTLDSLIRATAADDLWPALLQIGDEMPDGAIGTLARQSAFGEADVIRSVIDSVIGNHLWPHFRNQLPAMGVERVARVIEVAAVDRGPFLWELDRHIDRADDDFEVLEAAIPHLDPATRTKAAAACGGGLLAQALSG